MMIALVSQDYPTTTVRGGIAAQTWRKARGLAALGHDVHVIAHGADERPTEARDGRVVVERIPGPEARGTLPGDAAAWTAAWSCDVADALARLAARAPVDLVDVPDYGAEGFAWLAGRPAGGPHVALHLHGSLAALADGLGWPEPGSEHLRVGTALEDACLRLADSIYSSSAWSARWCERRLGRPEGSIPVLHAGVETDLFAPGLPPAGPPTVLFVGRIARSKGADVVVEAALRVAREIPGVRLRMFGRPEGDLDRRLRKSAEDAGRPDLLTTAGGLSRERLVAEMQGAHVFAAPSPFEAGPGLVYLEAMSAGLPAVACSGSGVTELLDEETGALVPPHDPDALAKALLRVLGDEPRRRRMAAEARRRVLSAADTRYCVARIADHYARAVRAGVVGGPA
jgi:glycosyltransferase involved in cell wall biosynthesis